MRKLAWIWVMVAAVMTLSSQARAEGGTVEVTVSYRERIALPPDAQLEVELLDVARPDAKATRIASQRFAVTGVPMTVRLTYDPQLATENARFSLGAVIWSGDRQVFALTPPQTLPEGPSAGPVEVVLSRVQEGGADADQTLPIAGIAWRVTEVLGEAWSGDDAATLSIDEEMRFSIFGGCNRFVGQLVVVGNDITFPPDFAGTLMACPEAVEAQERLFLAALRRVAHQVRYGAGLVLTDAGGNALVHFEQAPE